MFVTPATLKEERLGSWSLEFDDYFMIGLLGFWMLCWSCKTLRHECLNVYSALPLRVQNMPSLHGTRAHGINSLDSHAGNGARAKEPVNKSFSLMQELRLNFFNWRGCSEPDSSMWNLPPTRWQWIKSNGARVASMWPERWFIIINPLCPGENTSRPHHPTIQPTFAKPRPLGQPQQLRPPGHLSSTMSPTSLSKDAVGGFNPSVPLSLSLSNPHPLYHLSWPSHHGPLTRRPTITLFMAECVLISTWALSKQSYRRFEFQACAALADGLIEYQSQQADRHGGRFTPEKRRWSPPHSENKVSRGVNKTGPIKRKGGEK